MFKAPIKMLHPLLTATQEGNYIGTENIGAIPFSGVILAHSNEIRVAEFSRPTSNNEAFIDRIYGRSRCRTACGWTEEAQDLREADRRGPNSPAAPCAPATLDTLVALRGADRG